jgi:hypothetical protein
MGRMLVYVAPVALAIYALIDLYRSEANERAGLRPVLWALIILLIPVVGPIAWILVSTLERGKMRPASQNQSTRPARPARPKGPVAPDDDPEFLWRLDQQRRRDRRHDGDATPNAGGTPGGDGSPRA